MQRGSPLQLPNHIFDKMKEKKGTNRWGYRPKPFASLMGREGGF